jgi:hypothetical protein
MPSVWDAPKHIREQFKVIARRIQADERGCLPWPMKKNVGGYGEFHWIDPITRKRSGSGAHRISLELKLGRKLGEGMQACHIDPFRCRRDCINPEHLKEAGQSENNQDYQQSLWKVENRAVEELVYMRGQNLPWKEIARITGWTETQVQDLVRRGVV